jgi:hypothetical protein
MTEPPRDANLPPGFDAEDPYADADLEDYPAWWRETIDLFREYELRPYRPPRFEDGELTPDVIASLEAELGVEIRLRARNPEVDDDWGVWVAGEHVADIGRRRDGDGYTVYELPADRFAELVRTAAGSE